jgi:hypothetical protein
VAGRLTSITVKVGAGYNHMTPMEFARMPVGERIGLVMGQKVEFLDEDGQLIPALDAVGQLPMVAAGAPSKR